MDFEDPFGANNIFLWGPNYTGSGPGVVVDWHQFSDQLKFSVNISVRKRPKNPVLTLSRTCDWSAVKMLNSDWLEISSCPSLT